MAERGLAGGGWGRRLPALVGVLLLPIVAAYGIMARYGVDMPFIDDYPTILGFCVKYEGLQGAGARWHYILADQYLEYKLVFIHLVSAVELAATHHVSFTFLFWLGNLSLLPLLYLMWAMYRRRGEGLERRLALFLPVAFVLFSVNYGEALDWTATSVGYLGTVMLGLASMYFIVPRGARGEGWRRAGGCGCALAACLISANAFLLGPLGLLPLLRRRAYGWCAVWCGVFAAALGPYFVYFVRNTRFGHGSPLLIPVFFVSFLGAALQFVPLAVLVGVAILAVYAVALRTGFWRTHPAAMLGVTWLLVSAGLAAVGRGRTGLAFSVVSRYRIYSDLLLVFCYGYLVDRVERGRLGAGVKRGLYWGALAASVVFCLHGEYQAVHVLRSRRAMMLAGAVYYRAAPGRNSPMRFGDRAADEFFAREEVAAREYVEAAEREGLYRLPDGR